MNTLLMRIFLLAMASCLTVRSEDAAAPAAGKQPLKVYIAITESHGKRFISCRDESAHFHVVVQNVSEKPVRLWNPMCGWGYGNLSFELTDKNGQVTLIKKVRGEYKKDAATYFTLDVDECYVIEVHPASKEWEHFPTPDNYELQSLSLRAVFEVKEDESATREHVLTGKFMSKADEYLYGK